MASKWESSKFDDDEPGVHGVEVDIVCRNVPVVNLDKASEFEENAAWMIQTACDSSGKADSLYEYCSDGDIMSECRRLGLGKDEVCIVRIKDRKELRAVGASGKRSTMLACVIAMSIAEPDGLEDLWAGLRSYKLHRQYYEVMEMVTGLLGGKSGGGSSTYYDDSRGSKRKWADDNSNNWQSKYGKYGDSKSDDYFKAKTDRYGGEYDEVGPGPVKPDKSAAKWSASGDDWGGSGYTPSKSGSGRRGGGGGGGSKKQQWGPSTAQQLDDQLSSYFGD